MEIDEKLNIFKAIAGGVLEIKTPLGSIRTLLPEGNITSFSLNTKETDIPWEIIKINFKIFLPEKLTADQKKMLNYLVS